MNSRTRGAQANANDRRLHAGCKEKFSNRATLSRLPVTWACRAIYLVGDSQVGQWSLPVSTTVSA